MVHVVRRQGKNAEYFYFYENVFDSNNNKYVKKYLGKATKKQWITNFVNKELKKKSPKVCGKCGLLFKESLPEHIRSAIKSCQCGNI